MRNYNVVTKGEYNRKQTCEFLHLSRFIILYQNSSNHLLLEFKNRNKKTLTGINLQINQFDGSGKFLGAFEVEFENLQFKAGKFILKEDIVLDVSCVDVSVKVIMAEFGDFKYVLGKDGTYVVFDKKVSKVDVNAEEEKKMLGASGQAVEVRRFKPPVLVRIFAVVALLAIVYYSVSQIFNYSQNKDGFVLSNVQYKFVDGDSAEGTDVYVDGYVGEGGGDIEIPEKIGTHTVVSIKDMAFSGNAKITSVKIKGENIKIGKWAFENCNNLKYLEIDGVDNIAEYSFANCTNLRKVKLDNVKVIKGNAFYNCSRLYSINFPETINLIALDAFYGCKRIYEIKNDSSQNIVKGQGVAGYAVAVYSSSDDVKHAEIDGCSYVYCDGLWHLINCEAEGSLKLADMGDEKISIPATMFSGETYTEVNLGRSVKYIGDYAFSMSNIQKIVAEDGELVLGEEVFSNNYNLQKVDFSNVTIDVIPEGTFINNYMLSEVLLGDNNTTIGDYAFRGTAITEFKVPYRTYNIGVGAFQDCDSLQKVDIQQSVKNIGENAFASCDNLTTVVCRFRKNGLNIDQSAFSDCNRILVVYDLGYLNMSVGSAGFGGLMEKASAVFKSENDELKTHVENGITYKYNGSACIVTNCESAQNVEFTSLFINGFYYSNYIIAYGAFDGYYENIIFSSVSDIKYGAASGYYSNIQTVKFTSSKTRVLKGAFSWVDTVIYNDNPTIEEGAFSWANNFCYLGSENSWRYSSAKERIYENYHPSRYYQECFHNYGNYWNYNEDGKPNFSLTEYKTQQISQPTCESGGYLRNYCDICGYSQMQYLAAYGHQYVNGACVICGKGSAKNNNATINGYTLTPFNTKNFKMGMTA